MKIWLTTCSPQRRALHVRGFGYSFSRLSCFIDRIHPDRLDLDEYPTSPPTGDKFHNFIVVWTGRFLWHRVLPFDRLALVLRKNVIR